MKARAALLAVTVAAASPAAADILSDMAKQATAAAKPLIGQTFWIAKPFNQGLELCPSPSGRFKECKRVYNFEFTVKSITPNPGLGQVFLAVEATDGRKGYMNSMFSDHFLKPADVASRRDRILQCADAAPAIGMSAAQVNECWGPATQVNTTVTAAGRSDQLVYPRRGYVYLDGGIVTAVQISR